MPKKLTLSDFISISNLKHDNKFEYSKSKYINNRNKIIITCPIHGDFEQVPESHMKGIGCKKCSNKDVYTTDEFINKAKIIHGEKFDYSLVEYKNAHTKVKIKCILHGIFEQKPNNHLENKACPNCSKTKKHTLDTFITKGNLIHNNKFDYSKVKYFNNKVKVIIICPEHGEFLQTPNQHLVGDGCPTCKSSKGELKIRNYLIENNIPFIEEYKFEDCYHKNTLKFDFYLNELNTCIEYDGIQHFEPISQFGGEEGLILTQMRDSIKNKYTIENNINLIRISYTEIMNIDKILSEKLNIKL